MAENQKRILEMLSEKKITVEEAEKLLSLTGREDDKGDTTAERVTEQKRKAKYLRVVVEPGPDSQGVHPERVNIRVPVSLIRAGMKFAALIPPQAADEIQEALKDKGVKFDLRNIKDSDIEELIAALGDLEVDVDSCNEKVHVYTE